MSIGLVIMTFMQPLEVVEQRLNIVAPLRLKSLQYPPVK